MARLRLMVVNISSTTVASGEILRQPENEIVVNRDRLSLPEWSSSLARATPIRQVSPFGIESLGRAICIKKANRNTCLCSASGDQLLCRIHQMGGDPLPLELWKDRQVMDQRDIALAKQRIIRLPAEGQVAGQAATNPGQECLGLSLGVFAEMFVRPFGIAR